MKNYLMKVAAIVALVCGVHFYVTGHIYIGALCLGIFVSMIWRNT